MLAFVRQFFSRLNNREVLVDTRVMRTGCTITGILLLCAVAVGGARVPTASSNAHKGGVTSTPIPRPTPHPRPLPPITITNTNDSGLGSLRQALANAKDGDLIDFAAALHGQSITLTSAELVIDKNITINGPGADILTVSRSFSSTPFRIFHVMPGHNVAIEGLTISGGSVGVGEVGGGILNDHATLTVTNCTVEFNGLAECGGGICNDGSNGSATLSILNSTITSNSSSPIGDGGGICNDGSNGSATVSIVDSNITGNASPFGGGIINEADQGNATLTITNSVVSANTTTGGSPPLYFGVAGGIANYGVMAITNSTISDNFASNDGGGISNFGTLTITSSTITANGAGFFGGSSWPGSGGGISSSGSLTISNSTISGNRAEGNAFKGFGGGGGVANSGDSTATITNSTLSGNSADVGGGVSNVVSILEISNTIFNAGTLGENIFNDAGTVTSNGYNLSSDDGGGYLNGPGDQTNTDPMLGPLQDNGGLTFTHALLPGSPAIDAGDPNFTPPPYYDQRSPRFIRVFNGRIDIGSFETQPSPPPFPTPRPRPTPAPRPAP